MIFALGLEIFSYSDHLFVGDLNCLLFSLSKIGHQLEHLSLFIAYIASFLKGDIILRQASISHLYQIPTAKVASIKSQAKILSNIEDPIIYPTGTSIDVFRPLVSFPAFQPGLVVEG